MLERLLLLLPDGAEYVDLEDEDLVAEPLYSLLRVVDEGRVRTVASDCTREEDEPLLCLTLLPPAAPSPLSEDAAEERVEYREDDERFDERLDGAEPYLLDECRPS